MKTNRLPFVLLVIATSLPSASAQYFTAGGLGYNILSAEDHTVEVTMNESCTIYQGNINIPSTVEYGGVTYDVVALGEMAFYGASLSGITIPSSVTQIKQSCFREANGLATINVPASVTDIEMWAFAANGLNAINVDEANPSYVSIGGILFSKDTATLVECPLGKSGTLTLPHCTRHIAPCAFFDCKITSVTLPEGLASIDFWAFMGANRLNNVVIPSSVSYLGDNLFAGCSALNNLTIAEGNSHYYMDGKAIYSAGGDTLVSCHKSADSVFLPNTLRVVAGFGFNTNIKYVHVPDGVTTIVDNAFAYSSLKSIDLPSHLDRMEAYAFDYCTSLVRVGMPATLDTMGRGCFELCNRLASIDIPNGLRTIPREAFMYCTALAHVNWGDDVETIDSYAFGNSALAELQLPPSLRVVRYEALWKGRKLNSVIFSAPVDTIELGAFDEHPIGTLRLRNVQPPVSTNDGYGVGGSLYGTTVDSIIVPCGSLDSYLADSYWGQFADRYVEDCNMGINGTQAALPAVYANGGCIVVNCDTQTSMPESVCIYDIIGRSVATTTVAGKAARVPVPAGVYLVKVDDHPARKVVVLK